MPAARGVEVLMTILCWIVPVEEVLNWVLVVAAGDTDIGENELVSLNMPVTGEG